MRQKQCRDENGFNCHCMSESHQRQILVFGPSGKCKVDETPKGWFITYVDRDSETLLKNKRVKADPAEVEKNEREIRKQIEAAVAEADKELNILESGVRVGFALGLSKSSAKERPENSRRRRARGEGRLGVQSLG